MKRVMDVILKIPRKRSLITAILMGSITLSLVAMVVARQYQSLTFISQTELLKHLPTSPSARSTNHDPNNDVILLDVRTVKEYAEGHIPGAINIHYQALPDRLSGLAENKAQTIVVYCERGIRAGFAETTLRQAGFKNIVHLEGDMRAWRASKLPVAVVQLP